MSKVPWIRRARSIAAMAAGLALVAISLFAGPPTERAADEKPPEAPKAKPEPKRVPVEAARERARVLQTVYETSLHAMHRYYFDDDERMRIPAKALEDVFEVADDEHGSQTSWIAVSAPPMNVDNAPDTDFEKQAAKALRSGKEEFEQIQNDMYYRAGAITLRAGCLKCHLSALSEEVDRLPVAGFVMAIPVTKE